MESKKFGDKKIKIKKISANDLWRAKDFQEFINSLIKEDAMIALNKELSLKEEKDFLDKTIKGVRNKAKIYLIAEENKKIVGTTSIKLDNGRKEHICNFGITIRQGYRGMGLGEHLMSEILKLVKKELVPTPEIIDLRVFSPNKPAISLYKKMGFRVVAQIPKQRKYKGKLIDEIVMIKNV
jgi:ribosomal protein S18 acetylase RimI-like enzyme